MALYMTLDTDYKLIGWILTLEEARQVMDVLDCSKGSYWAKNILFPYLQAREANAKAVSIYTTGVKGDALSSALCALGIMPLEQ